MMEITEIVVTVTIHRYERAKSGQARQLPGLRRWAARLNAWTVAWYVFLTVAGVLLYKLGAAYAMQERGYFAIGGAAGADGEDPPEGPVPAPARTGGPALMGRYAKEKRSVLAMLQAYRKERGPGCLTELAQRAHVAESELRDMLECGKVPYSIWLAVGRALGMGEK